MISDISKLQRMQCYFRVIRKQNLFENLNRNHFEKICMIHTDKKKCNYSSKQGKKKKKINKT